jgi:hypothetical protein
MLGCCSTSGTSRDASFTNTVTNHEWGRLKIKYQRVIDQSKADILIKPGINTYPLVLFHLAITFHILLRLTDPDYSFRILKLSLSFLAYVCILLVCLSDQWFSHGIPVSSTNKTDRHQVEKDERISIYPRFDKNVGF